MTHKNRRNSTANPTRIPTPNEINHPLNRTAPLTTYSTLAITLHIRTHTYLRSLSHTTALPSPPLLLSLSFCRPLWNPISHALVIKCVNNTWKALLTVFLRYLTDFCGLPQRGWRVGVAGGPRGLTMGQLG